VSDSLDYSPERCTIVAAYNRLVVGAIIRVRPISHTFRCGLGQRADHLRSSVRYTGARAVEEHTGRVVTLILLFSASV
ncbi:hypothetical protein K438DRAFT_2065385, partial [Mycena galopus ATCC 62051]